MIIRTGPRRFTLVGTLIPVKIDQSSEVETIPIRMSKAKRLNLIEKQRGVSIEQIPRSSGIFLTNKVKVMPTHHKWQ